MYSIGGESKRSVQNRDRRDQRKKIAGTREKRSQGSDGRIASSDGEKIDREGGWNPHGAIFTVFLTSVQ
jgi:hypothetical protein